jgi:hypothetical protein
MLGPETIPKWGSYWTTDEDALFGIPHNHGQPWSFKLAGDLNTMSVTIGNHPSNVL